jgi:hypothetical protein
VEPVPQLWVGRYRVWLRPGLVGYHLVCELEGCASEVLLLPGAVSAWAAVGAAGLILAQDDRLVAYDLPTLEVRGRADVELNVHRIAVRPDATWAVLATGAQGNYRTHGDLLHLDLTTWQTRSLLDIDREVVDCELLADGRLRFVLGWTDEGDDRHHEGIIVPGDAPVALGPEDLRPLSASERAAIGERGEPA